MKIFTIVRGKLLAMVLLASSVVWLGSCNDDPEGPTQTILEILQTNTDLSSLLSELEAAGLDQTFASGEYTLFAPSNTALNNLLGTLGLTDFDPVRDDIATAVLTYHAVASIIMSTDLADGQTYTTLQGEDIAVVTGPALETGATSNSTFVETDIEATNGVVHIIDVVMIPPSIGSVVAAVLGTVAQPILLGEDFSTLADAIAVADDYATTNQLPTLVSILGDQQATLTVFAPGNAVFTAAGITTSTYTGEQWYGIIANHVADGNYGPGSNQTNFSALQQITTKAGGTLTVLATDAPTDPPTINSGVVIDSTGDTEPEAQIAVENAAPAGNGTVHAIAGVLAPQ